MNIPTPEQIAKLPKWAQEHVLSQSRIISSLHEKLDSFARTQSESPFYVDDFHVEPRIKRYIVAQNRTICADWAGVHVEIFLPRKDDGQRMFGPEIRFSSTERDSLCRNPVAIVPRGIELIHLVHKDNL